MLDFPRWKVLTISLFLALMVALSIPSFVPKSVRETWPSWVPKPAINLGLDLAGGSYLLLEGDTKDVAESRIEQMRDQVRGEMRRDPKIDIGDISVQGGKLSFMVRDPSKVDAAREKLLPITGSGVGNTGQREWDIAVVDTSRFVLTPTQAGINQAIETAMGDAREVVERRINALGTVEPTVVREGGNRIVVQVPGLNDPTALKNLLGKTAKLEFRLVDTTATQPGVAPPGSILLPYAEGGQIAVQRQVMITGDMLVNASQSYDPQTGAPGVTLQLDGAGSKRFAKVTQENSGKPFAIIVDNVVISAPRINEPILGGSAVINGGFTVQSANELAIALRSGKLKVPLKIVQESTVSPELGADSIKAGITASIIAVVAVIAFMILTYGRFGIYATIAVLINVLVILAMMGLINATLTLPGIAGFVLTIGTAVDANVLINERIREERRRGRSVIQAVELGYKEASRTIFEANVTHAIAGFIMLVLGSGPVRGFAVVLLFGIATSVFTAVVFTRMLVTIWLRRNRPSEIHI
ncbi:protein translocase subunit SecD [Sphingomonas psychrotolerans]|uniref:Protein translocase subunit SecD n=1 Tax=Sphingomonas psychrotolerans TaxID=1327635 RepID=A0ABU3N2U3_9SPHN|nr:protein translocase subunit SecD [Sphingomonas psychrotolerans]MDT8758869.1 protein translocase subunit SecD [Sphingomonas psychrotolerans]